MTSIARPPHSPHLHSVHCSSAQLDDTSGQATTYPQPAHQNQMPAAPVQQLMDTRRQPHTCKCSGALPTLPRGRQHHHTAPLHTRHWAGLCPNGQTPPIWHSRLAHNLVEGPYHMEYAVPGSVQLITASFLAGPQAHGLSVNRLTIHTNPSLPGWTLAHGLSIAR